MRRLFLILRREYLAYLLTPGFLLALVTFPLIFAATNAGRGGTGRAGLLQGLRP